MSVKTGPKLIIDHMVLYQLASDPAFFDRVPLLLFMRPQAREIVDKIVTAVTSPAAANCRGCGNVREAMQPLLLLFGQTVAAARDNPAAINPLIDYIAARRGFRPMPLVVYHKGSDGTEAVEL